MIRFKPLFLITLMCFCIGAARAETNYAEDFLEQQQQQRELERLQQKQAELPMPESEAEIPQEENCFAIDEIILTGNTLLKHEALKMVIEPYKSRCLGKNAINQLMERITSLYIDQGYITSRVYIAPQDLTQKKLELIALEGTIEEIVIGDKSDAENRKLYWAMAPDLDGVLNILDIEQAIDQINRVPSANAAMKLWPGRSAGTTRIDIQSEPQDEFRGYIERSNDGDENTGKQKVRLGLEVDNVIGINDAWGLNYIGSKDTNALSLNMSFPFRRWSFNLSHAYSEYLSILPQNTDLFGQSNTSTAGIEYLLLRNGRMKIKWLNSITVRRSERHLLGVELTPQRQAPLRTALNVSENKNWGFYSAEAGFSYGTRYFGADHESGGQGAPQNQFKKWDGRFILSVPLVSGVNYQSNLAWQYSDDILLSSEQINIGDKNTVRGYDEYMIAGDRGFYYRNDITFMPYMWLADGMRAYLAPLRYISFITALDTGYAEYVTDDHYRRVTGGGIGIGINHKEISGQVMWSKSFHEYSSVAQDSAIYANLQLQIF